MNDPGSGPGADTVGRFRVVSRLGDDVLLGADDTGRRAVVRLLTDATGTEARERFRRDVQLAAGAPPWFAAPVLDADPMADPPWIAIAHVPGPTLARYVADQGPLNDDGVFALASRMLDGLVALHGAGLTHHNLDPGTVILADDGPRVFDTGITGLAGPAGYRAPEADDPAAGPPADMYALGALLLHSATGRAPVLDAGGQPELDPLGGRMRDGVLGCLQADWAQRPTAAQLREYLGAGVAPAAPAEDLDRPTGAAHRDAGRPAARPHRSEWTAAGPPRASRSRSAVAIGAVLALVAAVAIGGVLLFGARGGTGAVPDATARGSVASAPATPAPRAPGTSAPGDPAAGAVVTDAATDPRFTATQARFVSPSRNIACTLTAEQARCDVLEREWPAGGQATGCPTSGAAAEMTGAVLAGGRATPVCGPVPAATGAVLEYDTGVRIGDVVCVSRQSGLVCQSASGHGFRLSRGSYLLY